MGDSPDLQHTRHHHDCCRCTQSQEGRCQAQGPRCPPPLRRHDQGSSRQAILKYICANYTVDAAKAAGRVRLALKKLVTSKAIVAAAAAGKKGAGSFKLAEKPKAAKPVKAKKKPAAKKA